MAYWLIRITILLYALIENVITHKSYRGKGYATAILDFAKEII
jgi:predicted GNAT family acetyltransferase